MEGSIVAVEENHQRADPTNAASNSLGSLVKIDSIYIDLGIAMEKENVEPGNKCHHFSIRGYVAEMRQKDRNLCSPFSLYGDDSNSEEEPMLVTKFRSWQCGNCLREIGAASASEEIAAVSKGCERGFVSTSSYSHMPSHGDAAVVQSHLNQTRTPENCEGREADLNVSANLNVHENYLSSCSDKRGKNAEVGDVAVNGCDNGFEDNVNQEVGNWTCELQLLKPCPINERHTDSTVPIQSKSSKSIEISEPNNEFHDAAGVLPAIEYPKSKADSSAEIFQKINSSDDEQRNVLINCNMSEEGRKIDEERNADKGKRIRLPSFEVEEFVKASSESEEIMAGYSDHSQHPEGSSGLQRRRTRKVRLLAELLGRENLETDNRRVGGGCSNAVPSVSNGLTSLSTNQDELALDGSIGNGFPGPQRKRKIDEETKTVDYSCLKNFGKKVRTLKAADDDLTKISIEISDSEMEDNASLGTKSKLKKHGIDRNPNLGQKKNKQAQVGDGYLQFGSWGDVSPKVNHNKIKDAERSGTTVADPVRNRGMGPYFTSYMSLQHTGKDSSSASKEKNRMPQVEDAQAFLMPPSRSMFEEGSIKRNEIRCLKNGSEIVKSRPGNDDCTKMGLDLSLNSLMNAERNDQIRIDQVADKSGFLMAQPKAIPSKDLRRKDGMFVGESSVSRKSAADPFMRDRLHYDLNERIAQRTAISREQQNCFPQLEDGSFMMHQNLDLSGPSNSKRSTEGHGRFKTIRRHSDERSGKVFEQGIADEVPMDIVELMARNQQERALCEAEKNYRRTNNKRNSAEMMGFSKVHGNGMMRILPKEYPSMRKPPPTNATNGIVPIGEKVVPTKQNHVNFFPPDHRNRFNMGPPQEENPGFTMFDAFSPNIQFQNSFQNDKAEHFWSFRPNVPEDCPTQASERDMCAQIPEKNKGKIIRDLDLNRMALNSSNLENPNNHPESEPYTGMSMAYHPSVRDQRGKNQSQKVMGSFDSFSNEAIPAMQLLSLMHEGLKTSKPFDVDPKRVLDKPFFPCGNHPNFTMDKTPFPCNYNSKAFSGLGSGVIYKAGESSRNPSSSHYGKNHTSEKICECASPATADPFVSLLQSDRNPKRPVGTENRSFFKSREQEKERRSCPTPQNKGRKSQKSGAPHTALEFNPVLDKQKGVVCPSKSALFKDSTKSVDLEGSFRRGTVRPLKITSRSEICTLNKNPADFSVPERGNVYTISGEDLRFPKRSPSKVKSKILRQ